MSEPPRPRGQRRNALLHVGEERVVRDPRQVARVAPLQQDGQLPYREHEIEGQPVQADLAAGPPGVPCDQVLARGEPRLTGDGLLIQRELDRVARLTPER